MKRMCDLGGALLGLLLLWPFFFLAGLAIKLEDGGPILFRQERIGQGGVPFTVWKLRTMVVDAERLGPCLTVGNDRRITRLGHWLRKFKLDELPQLVNVLVGQMSLVGPRPEVRKYVELYTVDQRRVLELKPGMTDPASIRYLRESELLARSPNPEQIYIGKVMPEKIRINLEYASRATVWSDLRVVIQTLVLIA